MQFMGQGNGDEIPHLMWIWVLPLEKKIKWYECRTEIKRVLIMQLRMNFYRFFYIYTNANANNQQCK